MSIILTFLIFILTFTIVNSTKINNKNNALREGNSEHGIMYNLIKRGLIAILPEDSYYTERKLQQDIIAFASDKMVSNDDINSTDDTEHDIKDNITDIQTNLRKKVIDSKVIKEKVESNEDYIDKEYDNKEFIDEEYEDEKYINEEYGDEDYIDEEVIQDKVKFPLNNLPKMKNNNFKDLYDDEDHNNNNENYFDDDGLISNDDDLFGFNEKINFDWENNEDNIASFSDTESFQELSPQSQRRSLSGYSTPGCTCEQCADSPEDYINKWKHGAYGLYAIRCVSSCLASNVASNNISYVRLALKKYITEPQYDVATINGDDSLLVYAAYRAAMFAPSKYSILSGYVIGLNNAILLDDIDRNSFVLRGKDATLQYCLAFCADNARCNSFIYSRGDFCILKTDKLDSNQRTTNLEQYDFVQTVYFNQEYNENNPRVYEEVTKEIYNLLGASPSKNFPPPTDAIALRVFDTCDAQRVLQAPVYGHATWTSIFSYLDKSFSVVIPREVQRRLIRNTNIYDIQYRRDTGCDVDIFSDNRDTVVPSCSLTYNKFKDSFSSCRSNSAFPEAFTKFCLLVNEPTSITQRTESCAAKLNRDYIFPLTTPLRRKEIKILTHQVRAFAQACLGAIPTTTFNGLTLGSDKKVLISQLLITNIEQSSLRTPINNIRIGGLGLGREPSKILRNLDPRINNVNNFRFRQMTRDNVRERQPIRFDNNPFSFSNDRLKNKRFPSDISSLLKVGEDANLTITNNITEFEEEFVESPTPEEIFANNMIFFDDNDDNTSDKEYEDEEKEDDNIKLKKKSTAKDVLETMDDGESIEEIDDTAITDNEDDIPYEVDEENSDFYADNKSKEQSNLKMKSGKIATNKKIDIDNNNNNETDVEIPVIDDLLPFDWNTIDNNSKTVKANKAEHEIELVKKEYINNGKVRKSKEKVVDSVFPSFRKVKLENKIKDRRQDVVLEKEIVDDPTNIAIDEDIEKDKE